MKSIKELGIKSTDAFQKASYWDNNGAYQKEGSSTAYPLTPSFNEDGSCDRLSMKEFYGN